MRNKLFALLLAMAAAKAQQQTVPLQSPPPPPPFNVGAVYSGGGGTVSVSYWVVARYASGTSSPSASPATVRVPNIAGITVGTPVSISFNQVAGATGYDVIRNTSTAYPAGAGCAACAIALNITGSPATDNGTTNAYPPAGIFPASQATALIDLNNRDAATPYLEVGINGAPAVQIPTGNVGNILTVFSQTGPNVVTPVTTPDSVTPSNPSAGNTKWYTKAGALCSLSPAGAENCTNASAPVTSVFTQTGAVDIPVTTTDVSTPANPAAGKTKWYTKGGTFCALNPTGTEVCISAAAVSSVFSQTGAVNIPVTTTDVSTPSNPGAGTTKWYTKAGALCSLSPAGAENCTNAQLHSIVFTINGNGSAIATGDLKVFPTADFSCTINRYDVSADQSGSITVDIWKAAGAIPTSGNKISASAPVTLSSAQLSQNGSRTGWTNAVSAGDVFGATVATAATVQNVTVQIWCQ